MFMHLHPVDTFTAGITDSNRLDPDYGYQYSVSGFEDLMTGDELGVFYLKKSGPI
ncbi:hypothetical protein ACX1C1_13525 [Paenibacillus sp. strain BS8-2]